VKTQYMISLARLDDLTVKARQKWGDTPQKIKTVEELSELSVVLCKALNGSPGGTFEAIVDEIADVLITVNQMRHHYGEIEVDNRMEFKLDRLEQAIERKTV
jgi:hypothetical protein